MIKQGVNKWALVVSSILCLALFQLYVVLVSPQVPYMDTMLFLVQIDQLIKGEISWFDVYGAGEHRGFIYPVITALEWKLWRADARISTVLTGFVVTAIFFLWVRAFFLSQNEAAKARLSGPAIFLIACFSAVIIASPAGFELWTLSLGFAQLLKNLLIIVFLYQLAIQKIWSRSGFNALIYGVCGGLLILFATYGWSYPFLIASVFILFATSLHDRKYRKNAAIVFGLMAFAQCIYIYLGSGVFADSKTISTAGFPMVNMITGFLYGAGTVFVGGELLAKWSLPVGVSIFLGTLLLLISFLTVLITLVQQSSAKIFLCSLLVFGLTVLAGVTVARGGAEFTNTGASRYFVDYVWIFLSPLAIVFTTHALPLIDNQRYVSRHLMKVLHLSKIIMAILLALAVLSHIATWSVEYKMAPYRAALLEAMASVYRNGVQNNDDALLLQSPYSVAKRGVEVAQRYELAVLGSDRPGCTLESATFSGDWYAPENERDYIRWMGKQGAIVLSKCTDVVTIKGYIPESFSQRKLQISYGGKQDVLTIVPGKEFSIGLDQMDIRRTRVTLQLDQITSPLQAGVSADQRELGVLLTYIGE